MWGRLELESPKHRFASAQVAGVAAPDFLSLTHPGFQGRRNVAVGDKGVPDLSIPFLNKKKTFDPVTAYVHGADESPPTAYPKFVKSDCLSTDGADDAHALHKRWTWFGDSLNQISNGCALVVLVAAPLLGHPAATDATSGGAGAAVPLGLGILRGQRLRGQTGFSTSLPCSVSTLLLVL